jgi:diguanylate cyclase (GGDEF)-like protein
MVTLGVALAGEAGGSLIDIYSVLMLYAFYFFAPRVAVFYAIACGALFCCFAFGVGYVDAGIRVPVTMTVMVVVISLVVKVRSVTVQFARTNRELSEVDALTGLANIRALRSRVATAVGLAESGGPRPALISIDLDKFKLVNDRYSHTMGDDVLIAVARAISESTRADDLVARRGGDEFVVLCTLKDPHQIDSLATRLGEAIVHARQRLCQDIPGTASIGWSAWEGYEDSETLLQHADLALHDVKTATHQRGHLRAVG